MLRREPMEREAARGRCAVRRERREDRVRRGMERYDAVVEDRAIATLRAQDAVLVPVMHFRRVGSSDPW